MTRHELLTQIRSRFAITLKAISLDTFFVAGDYAGESRDFVIQIHEPFVPQTPTPLGISIAPMSMQWVTVSSNGTTALATFAFWNVDPEDRYPITNLTEFRKKFAEYAGWTLSRGYVLLGRGNQFIVKVPSDEKQSVAAHVNTMIAIVTKAFTLPEDTKFTVLDVTLQKSVLNAKAEASVKFEIVFP
jgi:hypothetical protein